MHKCLALTCVNNRLYNCYHSIPFLNDLGYCDNWKHLREYGYEEAISEQLSFDFGVNISND